MFEAQLNLPLRPVNPNYGVLVVESPGGWGQVTACLLDDSGAESARFYATLQAHAIRNYDSRLWPHLAIFPGLPPGNYHIYRDPFPPPNSFHTKITVFPGQVIRMMA